MATLADVKAYLRVEHNGEDALINSLISVADSYLDSAVGSFCADDPRAQQIALLLISELYDNRSIAESAKIGGAIRRIVQDFAQQMRVEHAAAAYAAADASEEESV